MANIFEQRKIKLIKKKVDAIIADALEHNRFSLFMSRDFQKMINDPKMSYENLSYFYDLYSQWDKECHLPNNFGVFLDDLALDQTRIIGVRRVRFDNPDDLIDVMRNGSTNYGHKNAVGGGADMKLPPPALSFTPFRGRLADYINLVGSYGGNNIFSQIAGFDSKEFDTSNNIVIFAEFPRDIIDDDLGIIDKSRIDEVYDRSGNDPKVRPEHLIGATIKNGNGLDTFYTRSELVASKNK
jgi:hypothetical protein